MKQFRSRTKENPVADFMRKGLPEMKTVKRSLHIHSTKANDIIIKGVRSCRGGTPFFRQRGFPGKVCKTVFVFKPVAQNFLLLIQCVPLQRQIRIPGTAIEFQQSGCTGFLPDAHSPFE